MSQEKVFRSFTAEQGANYAQNRLTYSDKLYQLIIGHHTSTGGQLDTLVDIGCGPGNAARDLAKYFPEVIGLDPSEGMVSTARSLAGTSSTGRPIRFEVSTAEELGSGLSPPIPDGSVDLITAATAAHWFNMPFFWVSAARILKPGGTVAIWTSKTGMHHSMPNAAAIRAEMERLGDEYLGPYRQPGSAMAETLYRYMVLPWTLPDTPPIPDFDESSFVKKEWSMDEGEAGDFFALPPDLNLDVFERAMGTVSPVIGWREAHPEKVGTEEDVVKIMRRTVEGLLREGGVDPDKTMLKGGVAGVLLLVKKRA
ncbi:S-adenosyl-L-methionine-dependent methyltransferase [Mycena maculata]|uniref:S-adenosyl-L-methionine-dependent methyltransferase n=1 Tax=Mycena maculata TaxID=230809 RepID=A0AAD7N5F3_9AGAR|nr:S-adenosyl-L-methionine-dependent methyltransferase [Mycena maculata]